MSVAINCAVFLLSQAGGGASNLPMILALVAMFALLYLLMIRPQQKRQKQWQAMLAGIKTGDRVTTAAAFAASSSPSRTMRS